MKNTTMVVWAHKVTKRYYDYGSYLGTNEGLGWTADGEPHNVTGFEVGDFEDLLAKKREVMTKHAGSGIDLRIGPPVTRSVDMNPHGLM